MISETDLKQKAVKLSKAIRGAETELEFKRAVDDLEDALRETYDEGFDSGYGSTW
jgi:hypothetical protein